jgi:YD repeat-containing protein
VSGNASATIDVTGGSLIINNASGAASSIGALNVSSGASVQVQAGTFGLTNGGTIDGGTIDGALDVAAGATLGFYGENPVELNSGATLSGGGDFDVNGNSTTLDVNTDVTVAGSLTFEEGTVDLSSDLTVAGTFDLAGGEVTGSGTVNINTGATMNISGSSSEDSRINTALNNDGNIVWSGPSLVAGDGVFNNLSGATFTIENAGEFDPQVNNAGTLVATSSSGTGSINFDAFLFNNSGTVDVDAGSIDLDNDGTNTGVLNVAAGASLDFTSTNGTQNYTIGPGATWQGAGSLDIDGQFVDLLVDTNFTVPDLNLIDGAIDGMSDLTITGTLDWTGGTMQGTGTTTIPSGATLAFGGAGTRPGLDRTLENSGIATWSGSEGLAGNGVFDNLSGATFTIQNAGEFDPQVNNAGLLEKTSSSGTGSVSFPAFLFNNTGMVDINSGSITLFNDGTDTGIFDVASGSSLVYISTNGTQNFTIGPGATWIGGGSLDIDGGFADLLVDTNFIVPNLNLSEGAIDGTAGLTVTGTLDWTGGEMQGTGTTTIPAGASLMLTGSGSQILARTLDNAGTIDWEGGTLAFSDALINNFGVFEVGDVAGNSSHTGQFNNSGTFAKTAGTGTTSLAIQVFNNTGTVEVDSGTLDFSSPSNAPIAQISGTTLTGGTWNVLNGRTLLFPAGITVTANQANVTLSGAGAAFAALAPLAANAGDLTISNGASFTTAGALDNSGTITLGPSATLAVSGALTEESTATLDVELGGTSSIGAFGTLTATSQVSLAGTLGLALVHGFVPANGDSFQIVTDAGQTGTFASITRTSPGAGQLLAVAVNSTNITVTRQGAGSNLAVTSVAVQPTGVVGQNTSVSYTVENEDPSSTNVSSWQDSVFLSNTPTLTTSAVLIGRVAHNGTVAGDASYTGTITAPIPGVASGSYHVIVVADSQGDVTDTDRANDALASASEISVHDNALTPGTPATGTIASGQQAYFQLTVAAGSAVTLTLTTPSAGGAQLFTQFQAEPTSSDYDEYAFNDLSTTQTITIPGTQAGTYYIMLSGAAASGTAAGYSLTAAVQAFGISAFSPSSGSNQGQVTLTVSGSRFTPETAISLVPSGSGAPRPATQVIEENDSTLYATFNLAGLGPGSYHVVAGNAESQATASGLFTVNTLAPGSLALDLNLPSGIRANFPTPVTVTFTNTGATDIPAPILVFTADTAQVRFPSQSTFSGNTVDFLGINPNGPAGILTPGASGSVTLILETTFANESDVNISVGPVDPSLDVDWAGFQAGGPPTFTSALAWAQIVANLSASIGTTEGRLQSSLDAAATYLGTLGAATTDVNTLFSQELLSADAQLPVATLGTQTDASMPTPGALSLDLTRSFMQPLSGRDAMGPFGLGWTDDWDIVASTDGSGNVTIDDAGFIMLFTLLPNGTFQSQPGDFDTLTALSGGGLQLQALDGTLEVFNANGTLAYEQDNNGNRITAGFNSAGRLSSLTASSGQSLTLAYNAAGLVSSVTDSFGRVTTYSYDSSDQHLLSVTAPQGTTTYTYRSFAATKRYGVRELRLAA